METKEAPPKTLFHPAENQTAYLKAGLLGFAGSGKSYTAYLMAVGIYARLKKAGLSPKPVFFQDTETGSDFLAPMFKKAGIPLLVNKSRAFTDLLEGVKSAEKEASVLIIDSVSHFWTELQEAYKAEKRRTKLLFQDWGPLKSTWRQFTDIYLNSKVHIVMCGRAGYEYDYFIDESGAKQLEKTGTKMKAETDMGYEPSLLIEMVRERKELENKRKVEARLWDHVAYVLKDRTTRVEGARFVNPTFKDFEPVFSFLNIAGEHVGVETQNNSRALFEKDNDQNFLDKRKRVEVLKEEIMGELLSAFPGQSAEEKKAKTDLVFLALGTRSWVALDDMSPEILRRGLDAIKQRIAIIQGKTEKEEENHVQV